ncbi:hypothetical protein [Tahibacter amnicola]|uniref:Small integral membrane protein n=1 Tax=Tahibacter amnicola TaxID=2976241 RepID=A0ABY6BNI0_9GAMM|nr:hypothetical protein [Tahibacter amnicola]UXI70121.1 hypothetical protein N4264_10970 [Tahibacter amnicola]
MNTALMTAGLLMIGIGAIHSSLGEWLIFRHVRARGVAAHLPAPPLAERHVRILWATWHIVTVMGWMIAAVLIRVSRSDADLRSFLLDAIFVATAASAVLVLLGTRGRHPGWIGLGLVAAITLAFT